MGITLLVIGSTCLVLVAVESYVEVCDWTAEAKPWGRDGEPLDRGRATAEVTRVYNG